MKKETRWIILFGVLLLGFGFYRQYFASKTDARPFTAPLFRFAADDVEALSVQSLDSEPFHLKKQGRQWVLSNGHAHVEADSVRVLSVLTFLQNLQTTALLTSNPKQWAEYGVADQQGLQICITAIGQSKRCVHLGQVRFASGNKVLTANARMDGQKEVFSASGLALVPISANPDDYRSGWLVLNNAPFHAFELQKDSMSVLVTHQTNGWFYQDSLLSGQSRWEDYAKAFRSMRCQTYANNFDELNADKHLRWRLLACSPLDTLRLECYLDSSLYQVPVFHSSQYPQAWFVDEDGALERALLRIWKPLLSKNQDTIVHANNTPYLRPASGQ